MTNAEKLQALTTGDLSAVVFKKQRLQSGVEGNIGDMVSRIAAIKAASQDVVYCDGVSFPVKICREWWALSAAASDRQYEFDVHTENTRAKLPVTTASPEDIPALQSEEWKKMTTTEKILFALDIEQEKQEQELEKAQKWLEFLNSESEE